MFSYFSNESLNAVYNRVTQLCEGLEIKPFFGTLLGFVRDKDFIKHDDDIDLLLNRRDLAQLLDRLKQLHLDYRIAEQGVLGNGILKVYFPSQQFFFLGLISQQRTMRVDFYIFQNSVDGQFVEIDSHWNTTQVLLVPQDLVDSVPNLGSTIQSFDSVKMTYLCHWLYGDGWNKPLGKESYTVELSEYGAPILTPLTRGWPIARLVKRFVEKQFPHFLR